MAIYEEKDFDVEKRVREDERKKTIDIFSNNSDFKYDAKYGYPPELEEFDPTSEEIPEDYFLILEARRRVGKSFWARWFLSFRQDSYEIVVVMTKTKMNGYWQKIVGPRFVHQGWHPNLVTGLIERNRERVEEYGKGDPENKVLIILDDIISEKIHDDKVMAQLATEGRHYDIAVMIMTQKPKAIGTDLRDNTDIAVIFNQRSLRARESCYEDFMCSLPKDEALPMLDAYTKEHKCVVVQNFQLNNDRKVLYKKCNAEEVPDYILGGEAQRRMYQEDKNAGKIKSDEQLNGSVKTSNKQHHGNSNGNSLGKHDRQDISLNERNPGKRQKTRSDIRYDKWAYGPFA